MKKSLISISHANQTLEFVEVFVEAFGASEVHAARLATEDIILIHIS